ncbi:MAG: hypothetical protein PHE09_15640 [Oscillospiraceae bacterium]|nr:hypothetical protein [Oscillospiraceae bacterium]
MAKVLFGHHVKYGDKFHKPNTAFTVKDEDVDLLVKMGAKVVNPAVPKKKAISQKG